MIAWLKRIFQNSLAFNPNHRFSPSCSLPLEPEHFLRPNLGFFQWRHHPAASSHSPGLPGIPSSQDLGQESQNLLLAQHALAPSTWVCAPSLLATLPGGSHPLPCSCSSTPSLPGVGPVNTALLADILAGPPPSPALLKPLMLPETFCLLSCPRSRALRFLNCSGCSFLNSLQLSSINCR